MYIWEQNDWPNLTWDESKLATLLAKVSRKHGHLLGKIESLGFQLQKEAHLRILTEDVVKSSAIDARI